MKKLILLLVICLCVNGLTGVSFAGLQSARAEKSSAKASEERAQKKSGKKKDSKGKKAEEKAKKEKKAKEEEKSQKESKKTEKEELEARAKAKLGAEKRYELDLAKNGTVLLSTILKAVKMGIKLEDVKAIEYENKEDKKLITWEPDEENERDYIFTVLKNFKTVQLRIVTKKKDSKLLVLLNGAKAKSGDADKGKKKETKETEVANPVKDVKEAPAVVFGEDILMAPGQAPVEEIKELTAEASVEGAQETPAGESLAEADPAPAEPSKDDGSDGDAEKPEKEEKPTESEIDGDSLMALTTAVTADGLDETEGSAVLENVESESTPTESQGEVSEAQGEPSNPQGEPAEDQGAPNVGEGTPAEDQGTPTEDQGMPTEDQGAPAEGQDTPAEGQGTPAEGQGEPTVDQGEPAGDQNETAGEPGTGDAGVDPAGDTPTSPEDAGEGGATIPAEAEAWFKRNGELFWGTLEQIVANLNGGETVYIQSTGIMAVREAPLQMMSTVTLLPDGSVFQGSYVVNISTEDPTVAPEPVLIQPADMAGMGERADLFIWVGEASSLPPEEEPGEETEKPVLTVTATGLVESGWSTTQPQFTLSGIPEGKNWSYAAVIYDERIVPIAGDTYAPDVEGVYALRFAMLDELGDIMSASDQYSLQLDWTAPEVSIEADEETSYTLNISATDNCSGVDAVSVDGGKSWHVTEDGSYTVTKDEETTFAEGDIMVRDVAGNVFISDEEYTVEEVESDEEEDEDEGGEGGGGGGGGGGSGSGTAALPHASGDGEEGSEYDALTLDLPDAPMVQLTVGGEPMALTLKLASAQEPDVPVGVNQPFTARLRHWDDAADDDALNTLVLNAESDFDLGDVFTYEWRFNGEVYRMLANSGIKYVALQVGNTVAAFPTVGFTGGTKYTELKMEGVSTRRFDYTLTMKMNLDPSHVSAMSESDHSQECDLSIHAEVEDTNYELSNSPQSLMYYYNVFVGPEDMMDQPFGEYDENA